VPMPEESSPQPSEPSATERPPSPPPQRARIPGWVWLIVGAILVAGLVVGVAIFYSSRSSKSSEEPSPSKTYELTGTLSAPECSGGFEIEGASVDVRDQNDKLIGSGTTSFNTLTTESPCQVDFEVAVPKATFYQITIGTHGGPSYSFEVLQGFDFHLDLSL
jgi:hypothetical protein